MNGEPVPEGIGRYDLEEELAHGAMGIVYLARDVALGRPVAVKVMRHDPRGNDHLASRFLAEARITGQLQHPGVPPVFEVGQLPDGSPFMAMKLIKGRTLKRLLQDRPSGAGGLSPPADRGRFVAVFEQIAQAIGYAHAHKVIHRDLKPDNVMVGAFGEVQVMDWGLAKVLTEVRPATLGPDDATLATSIRSERDASDATRAGSVMGTPAYMPREQAIGAIDQVDERSDVFGLGAILCEILTGKPPYAGQDSEAVRQLAAVAKLDEVFARLDACGAEPDLVTLCKRCLSPERTDRPENAGVVAEAVAALRAAADERARQAELDRVRAEGERAKAELRAAEQRKRRRAQFALAAAVGLLLLGSGAFAWWREKTRAEQAVAESERKAEQLAAGVKAESARERIQDLLALATELRAEYRYAAAGNALRQATELAGQFAPDLTPAAEQGKADLSFVVALDAIRMSRTTLISLFFPSVHFEVIGEAIGPNSLSLYDEKGEAHEKYRAAFAARGLDVVIDPEAAADRVAASAVRADLVTALDDWLILETDGAVRDKVLAVLRRADPGSGAAPFRDPAVWADPARLKELAAAADAARMSPGAVVAVAEVMRRRGADPAPLLRHAVALHPRDFLLVISLGKVCKDAPEAIGAYRAARAIRPDNFTLLVELGNALYAKQDFDGAVAAYREAARLDPKAAAAAHNNQGWALYAKKDFDGAIIAYREAVRLDPKFAPAHYSLGIALYAKQDFDGAAAAHRAAIELDPKFAHAHRNLGRSLHAKKDFDGAAAAYRAAIELNPTYALAHFNLGLALKARGDMAGAVAAYRAAIGIDPKFASPRNNLAWLLATGPAEVRNGKMAVEYAEEACHLTAWKNPVYIDTLAAAYAEAGDFGKAIEFQKRALSFPVFDKEYGEDARKRIELFKQGKAYHDPKYAVFAAPPPREVTRP